MCVGLLWFLLKLGRDIFTSSGTDPTRAVAILFSGSTWKAHPDISRLRFSNCLALNRFVSFLSFFGPVRFCVESDDDPPSVYFSAQYNMELLFNDLFWGERYGFCVRHCRFLFWRFYCFLCVFFFSLMIPRKDGGPDIFTTPFPLIIIKNKTVFFFFPARNEKKSEGGQPEETLGMVRKVIKYSMAPIMAPLS